MKKKQGFTLVEIMIVVAIIGLLAAIGIPSFQKARANSILKSKENNIRICEAAVEEWAMETAQSDGADVTATILAPYIKGATAANLGTADGPLAVGSETITIPATVGANATY